MEDARHPTPDRPVPGSAEEPEAAAQQTRASSPCGSSQEKGLSGGRNRRSLAFQFFTLLALGAFAVLAWLARASAYFPIDLVVTRDLQGLVSPLFAALMRAVSWPGYAPQAALLVILVVGLLHRLGWRWEALVLLGLSVAEQALNFLIKILIQRPRPSSSLVHVVRQLASYSFPSGHVMFYSAFFGFLAYLVYTSLAASRRRALLLLLLSGLALLVGPSRLYLGEHWASDVLGGYLLGGLCLLAAIQVYCWGRRNLFLRRYFPLDPEPLRPPERTSASTNEPVEES